MCTILYNFSNSKLLLCIDADSQNDLPNITSNKTNTTVTNTTEKSLWNTTAPPANSTAPPANSTIPPTNSTAPPANNTVLFTTAMPYTTATPIQSSPSPSVEYITQCTPCICPTYSPSPKELLAPSPSVYNTSNITNTSHSQPDAPVPIDYSWLHVFWLVLPIIAVTTYACARKKCCARMKVGFLSKRIYTKRSKSWPIQTQESHPAMVPRSKSTNFDSIVI